MKLHYLAIVAVTSIAANIGTVSAAVSIDYIGLAGCSYDVHFMSIQYPSHIISYSYSFSISLLEVLLLPTLKVQTPFLPKSSLMNPTYTQSRA